MNITDGLTFDDVLLIPEHSDIPSRSEIDLSVDLGKGIKLNGPFISANMKTVTGPILARNMEKYGMGILHRFASIEEQTKNFYDAIHFLDRKYSHIGVSIGISSEEDNNKLIEETNTKIVCIDVAHGDHARVLKETERLANKYPDVLLIVGNIATGAAARRLRDAGADVVKAGVGSGSLCTTRIETGNGVPQLTALYDVFMGLGGNTIDRPKIIADGGIRRAGDCVKALCFSDAVMLGSILSGTAEAPGDIITVDGLKHKQYAGSSTHKTNRVEGVAGLVRYKGSMHPVMQTFMEGVQSGLSYQGCRNLTELKDNPRFVKISGAGLSESHPHANLIT